MDVTFHFRREIYYKTTIPSLQASVSMGHSYGSKEYEITKQEYTERTREQWIRREQSSFFAMNQMNLQGHKNSYKHRYTLSRHVELFQLRAVLQPNHWTRMEWSVADIHHILHTCATLHDLIRLGYLAKLYKIEYEITPPFPALPLKRFHQTLVESLETPCPGPWPFYAKLRTYYLDRLFKAFATNVFHSVKLFPSKWQFHPLSHTRLPIYMIDDSFAHQVVQAFPVLYPVESSSPMFLIPYASPLLFHGLKWIPVSFLTSSSSSSIPIPIQTVQPKNESSCLQIGLDLPNIELAACPLLHLRGVSPASTSHIPSVSPTQPQSAVQSQYQYYQWNGMNCFLQCSSGLLNSIRVSRSSAN